MIVLIVFLGFLLYLRFIDEEFFFREIEEEIGVGFYVVFGGDNDGLVFIGN